jgi:hypothetical protein
MRSIKDSLFLIFSFLCARGLIVSSRERRSSLGSRESAVTSELNRIGEYTVTVERIKDFLKGLPPCFEAIPTANEILEQRDDISLFEPIPQGWHIKSLFLKVGI